MVFEIAVQQSRDGDGPLSKEVLAQYDAALALPTGRSAMVRKIALEAVEKLPGKNKYKICVAKPFFDEYQLKTSTDFGVRKAFGDTYTFAKRDAGGHNELMAAVKQRRGERSGRPQNWYCLVSKKQFECGQMEKKHPHHEGGRGTANHEGHVY